jgi:hypothetical protein
VRSHSARFGIQFMLAMSGFIDRDRRTIAQRHSRSILLSDGLPREV